jgi:hypothetical protein
MLTSLKFPIIFGLPMANALDNWTPPVLDKPHYFDTVKFVYKYLDFHISEDEAYTILNVFIEKWDTSAGQLIHDEDLINYVLHKTQHNFMVLLPGNKIKRVTELILGYLRETGHYYHHEL